MHLFFIGSLPMAKCHQAAAPFNARRSNMPRDPRFCRLERSAAPAKPWPNNSATESPVKNADASGSSYRVSGPGAAGWPAHIGWLDAPSRFRRTAALEELPPKWGPSALAPCGGSGSRRIGRPAAVSPASPAEGIVRARVPHANRGLAVSADTVRPAASRLAWSVVRGDPPCLAPPAVAEALSGRAANGRPNCGKAADAPAPRSRC
jgi:hypothetical protein